MARLESRIRQCMLTDQRRFRRRLRSIEQRAARNNGRSRGLENLEADIARSEQRRLERVQCLPSPSFPGELPISAQVEAIAQAIRAHPVVIVCGETGSGKTTQIPKICLSVGRGAGGLIGHTQPRRVAARSTAARIAAELGTELGGGVGYKLRFDQQMSDGCYLKVLTDGMLLAEIQSDRRLEAYDTIIIDEAHERSLNIDFLLGYIKTLQARRPDLKLVISSATIDTQRFAEFFDGAPVIEVSGRGYPVEVRYRPLGGALEAGEDGEPDLHDGVVEAVDALCAEGPGDILVFLPGERDIRALAQRLRRQRGDACEVLPVYARLPLRQQQRLFEAHTRRRVVLATNVAETSVTVPGIRYVVDSGLARISRTTRRGSIQRLPIEPVSRASADQRAGRCGRVGPGTCVRLYSEDSYLARPRFTEPEIRRTDLAAVLLEMRALGIDDLDAFPFLDAPDRRRVNDGQRLLRELGAIDAGDVLTPLGRRLARLPVDPRIGRMILAAEELDCLAQVLVLAAALSVADPRERPPDAETAAAAAHRRYQDTRSDFMALLNLWDQVHAETRGFGSGKLKSFCRRRYLSLPRLREWQEVHRQLREIVRHMGLRPRRHEAGYSRIHRALLAGLLRNVGLRTQEGAYAGLHDTLFHVSSQSSQAQRRPRWVVAAELVETSRLYAHQVARIRPEWIERSAGDLLRRNHFDAHWDADKGEVMVYEQTTLHGLTVTPRRRVRLAPISRADAHAIFIQSALIDRKLDSPAAFLAHNAAVVDGLRRFEHKLRRPDVLISDDDVYSFYTRVIPESVCDSKSFEAWRRRAERETPQRVRMDPERLGRGRLPEGIERDYPDSIRVDGEVLALAYRFDPGADDDGVSVEIPLERLAHMRAEALEWLVPGLLEEKVLAMLKLLPKSSRRELLPLADCAQAFVREGAHGGAGLANALRDFLRRHRGVDVPGEAWRHARLKSKLPAHLMMNCRVIGEDSARVGEGRDLLVLQARLARRARRTQERTAAPGYAREGLRDWVVASLPDRVEERIDGRVVQGYPALSARADSVALDLFASAEAAAEAHPRGVRRLYALGASRSLRRLERGIPNLETMELMHAVLPPPPEYAQAVEPHAASLLAALRERAVEKAMPEAGAIRDETGFRRAAAAADAAVAECARDLGERVHGILTTHRRLAARLAEHGAGVPRESVADIEEQLAHLVYRGFVACVPLQALEQVPRYLAALETRFEKLLRGGAGDARKLETIAPLWRRFTVRAGEHAARARRDAELERYRWMLEEYRISVFAQELGTAYPVSRKRLEAQWRKVSL